MAWKRSGTDSGAIMVLISLTILAAIIPHFRFGSGHRAAAWPFVCNLRTRTADPVELLDRPAPHRKKPGAY